MRSHDRDEDIGLNTTLDSAIVRLTMAGYGEANRLAAAERRARLRGMSDDEARRIFDDLVATYQHFQGEGPGWERLGLTRIQDKRAVRQAFEQLARSKGLA